MNKKDYDRDIKGLDSEISVLLARKKDLVYSFKMNCPHKAKDMAITSFTPEDEYGRRVYAWTTYDYTCTRCGAEASTDNRTLSLDYVRSLLRGSINK